MLSRVTDVSDLFTREMVVKSKDFDNIKAPRYRDSDGFARIVVSIGHQDIVFKSTSLGDDYEAAARATIEVLDTIVNRSCTIGSNHNV